MFLVSEAHPFDDGNGRLARVMMNAELVAGLQSRIIIPTVFRDDYLGGLRLMARQDDPAVLIKRSASVRTTPLRSISVTWPEPDGDERLALPSSLRPSGR